MTSPAARAWPRGRQQSGRCAVVGERVPSLVSAAFRGGPVSGRPSRRSEAQEAILIWVSTVSSLTARHIAGGGDCAGLPLRVEALRVEALRVEALRVEALRVGRHAPANLFVRRLRAS
jgi:hypothetical protein